MTAVKSPSAQVPEFVDAAEAARLLEVKIETVYAYAARGLLHSYRQGRKRGRLYRRAELEELRRLEPARTPAVRLPRAEDWIPYT